MAARREKIAIKASGFSSREHLVFEAMKLLARIDRSSFYREEIIEAALAAMGSARVLVMSSRTWKEGSK